MNQIALLFGASFYSVSRTNSELWCVSVGSLAGVEKVINYFEEFPLKSSKYLDYKDWSLVFHLINNKLHLSKPEETFSQVKILKSSTNKVRTTFNWNHLSNFYEE